MQWLGENQHLMNNLGSFSLALLVVTIVALPLIIMSLPEDYFLSKRRQPARKLRKYPIAWAALSVLRNALGILLILAGVAMLVLPGQGMICILIGLAISNFPGKFALERRIVGQAAVGSTLNKIRKLTGKPPLRIPECG